MRVVVVPVNSNHREETAVVSLGCAEGLDLFRATALDADRLLAKRVLVNSDEIFILQDGQ